MKKTFAGSEVAEMIQWLKEFAQRHEAPRIVLVLRGEQLGGSSV